jgi:hypothetical protein
MCGEEHTWDSMSYPEFELCLRLPACGNKQTQVGMGIRQAQYRTPQCHRFIAEDRDGTDFWLLSSRSSRLHAVQTGSRTAGTVPDFIDRKGWDKAFEWCTKDEVAEPIAARAPGVLWVDFGSRGRLHATAFRHPA